MSFLEKFLALFSCRANRPQTLALTFSEEGRDRMDRLSRRFQTEEGPATEADIL